MHPDAIIKGLRRELASVPESDKDRRAAIEAEIDRTDKLPRPRIAPELGSFAVADQDRELLVALRRELSRVSAGDKDRRAQIQAEIDRVEAAIAEKVHGDSKPEAKAKPAAKALKPKAGDGD